MRCGQCGSSYVKISAQHFGSVCLNRLAIRRDTVEALVLDGLGQHLMDPGLFKEFVAEFHREVNRLRLQEMAEATSAKDELARIQRRLKKLIDIVLESDEPPHSLMEEMRRLERRQQELTLQLHEPASNDLLHPGLADIYHQKIAALHELLTDPTTRDEAAELIRSLVEAVVHITERRCPHYYLLPSGGYEKTFCKQSLIPPHQTE